MSKKIISILTFILILFIISGCSENPEVSGESNLETPDKIVIQIAYPLGKGTVSDESAKLYKEIVENEIGDKVEIKLFPDGQLGDDVQVLEGLRLGTHDATIIASTIASIEPKFNFFELPYLFNSREDVEKITQGTIGEELLSGLEEKGLKGMAYWNSGWRNITTSSNPIETPEDLEGLKIRVPSSPSRIQLFELLGANPTPLSFSELFSALQQNVVDGQENPSYVITSANLNEVQDYLSITNHVYTSNYLLFNNKLWDSFPDDVQQVLSKAAEEVSDKSWEIGATLDEETMNEIRDDMEINEPDLSRFIEIAEPMYENPKLIDPIGQDLMNEILDTLGR